MTKACHAKAGNGEDPTITANSRVTYQPDESPTSQRPDCQLELGHRTMSISSRESTHATPNWKAHLGTMAGSRTASTHSVDPEHEPCQEKLTVTELQGASNKLNQSADPDRRVLVVQHAEPEGPHLIAAALGSAGVSGMVVRTDRCDSVPTDAGTFAGIVVMGGPMCAADDSAFPTRGAELRLLESALENEVPTLGVCLGAQLLAVAAGAAIHRGGKPEVGWGEVDLLEGAQDDPLFKVASSRAHALTVLHWHSDTFDLPAGAVHLASSQAYRNQAFRLGVAAWALQFHIEVDANAVDGFVEAFPEDAEMAQGGADAISATTVGFPSSSAEARLSILDNFAAVVAQH